MNKHQTLVYLKYGKLINEINDKIIDYDIKFDMIKFLVKFLGTLKQPETSQFKPGITKYKYNNKIRGRFKFEIIKLSKIIYIDFHGNNNFQIFTYNKCLFNNSNYYLTWASTDDIEYYVDTHLDDLNNIIK